MHNITVAVCSTMAFTSCHDPGSYRQPPDERAETLTTQPIRLAVCLPMLLSSVHATLQDEVEEEKEEEEEGEEEEEDTFNYSTSVYMYVMVPTRRTLT